MSACDLDTQPRGLLVPAWGDVGHRPILRVTSGPYAGLTVHEVAEQIGCSVRWVREQLLDGQAPMAPPTIGPSLTQATLARRRAAGVPEPLLTHSMAEIARELRVSQSRVVSAIYYGGRRLGDDE